MAEYILSFFTPSETEISPTLKISTSADLIDILEDALPIIKAVGAQKAAEHFTHYCRDFLELDVSGNFDETIFVDESENISAIYEKMIKDLDAEKNYRLNLDSLTLKTPDGEYISLPRWDADSSLEIFAQSFLSDTTERNFPVKKLLDLIYRNPFFEIEQIFSDGETKTFSEVVELLSKADDSEIFLTGSGNSACQITFDSFGETVKLFISDVAIRREDFQQKAVIFLQELSDLMPQFEIGRIISSRHSQLTLNRKSLSSANTFGGLTGWYVLLSEDFYSKYFSQQDLLKTPSYNISLTENKKIGLMYFPDPFGYNSFGSRKLIQTVSEYLNSILRQEKV